MSKAIFSHKTLYVVIFWLIALLFGVLAPSGPADFLPDILGVTGWICLAYVGLAKAADIVTAARAPKGQYGFELKTFVSDQYWWIVAYWCALLVLMLILRLIRQGALYPLSDCIFFAGTLSAAYAGLNKGSHVAAAAGIGDPSSDQTK